jgi:hypothetical protein
MNPSLSMRLFNGWGSRPDITRSKQKRKMIMENEIHICKNCGKAAKDTGHLCDPVEMKETYICEHCGQSSKDPRHICKPKLQHINFVCISCGRVAELPGQLCNPRDIVLMTKDEPPTKII